MGIIKILILVFAANLAQSFPVVAKDAPYGPYRADVVKIKDGDTILIDVHIWPGLTKRISLRLDGINTPEKRNAPDCEKKLANEATEFVQNLIQPGDMVTVHGIRPGKYAKRVLGTLTVGGQDLGQLLMQAGHAKEYHGKRNPWCQD